MEIKTTSDIQPLTDEQLEQMDEFFSRSQVLIDSIRERRKGKPLPSSWRLIRKAREERSKRL